MELFILELVAKYPTATSILLVIGVLRAVFKPLQGTIDAYVKATPSVSDDGKWEKVKAHKAFKALAWVIDYTASIKLPGRK